MRQLLAIGMLGLAGCYSQPVILDDIENECEISEVKHTTGQHTFYVETYQCSGEIVKESDEFFAPEHKPDVDLALLSIKGPL